MTEVFTLQKLATAINHPSLLLPPPTGEQIYTSEYILDVYTSEYILEVSNQNFEFLWIVQVTINIREKYITFSYTPNRCLINQSKGH